MVQVQGIQYQLEQFKRLGIKDGRHFGWTPSLWSTMGHYSSTALRLYGFYGREATLCIWSALWNASPRHDKFTRLDKSATIHSIHKPLINLSRRNSSLIVQLRTRMVGLSDWLHKIHRAESPLCQTCQRREDVPHFIFFCSRFSHHRIPLRAALGRKATSLGYLLTDEKGIRHLLRYIHSTNRLPAFHDIPPPEPAT